MAEEWRKTLSIYVNEQNQDEVDYRTPSAGTVVTDLDYLLRRGERKRKLDMWYRSRGAAPLRCETRAKLVREIEKREDEIEVDLQLLKKIYYEKGGARHQEERIEKQRLTLQRDGAGWVVSRVELPVPERHPSLPFPAREAGEGRQAGGAAPVLKPRAGLGGARQGGLLTGAKMRCCTPTGGGTGSTRNSPLLKSTAPIISRNASLQAEPQ
ncbi:hypothetical protein HMSSN036_83800 [Paenibacillus macerans]|nr:hypothetical protein HMSSN036_83800 [Paenibacillus macerans]